MFTPVQTRRTFEEAAEQIADKVRIGELRVGDKLPGERALAAQMQISRPTLREAVKVLVDAGLLEVRRGPGGGMFVATDVVGLELVRQRFEPAPRRGRRRAGGAPDARAARRAARCRARH